MLVVKCPRCEAMRRPYKILQTPGKSFKMPCKGCGLMLFFKVDYVIKLAPIDIVEAWTDEGDPVEVVVKPRKGSRQIMEVEDDMPGRRSGGGEGNKEAGGEDGG